MSEDETHGRIATLENRVRELENRLPPHERPPSLARDNRCTVCACETVPFVREVTDHDADGGPTKLSVARNDSFWNAQRVAPYFLVDPRVATIGGPPHRLVYGVVRTYFEPNADGLLCTRARSKRRGRGWGPSKAQRPRTERAHAEHQVPALDRSVATTPPRKRAIHEAQREPLDASGCIEGVHELFGEGGRALVAGGHSVSVVDVWFRVVTASVERE